MRLPAAADRIAGIGPDLSTKVRCTEIFILLSRPMYAGTSQKSIANIIAHQTHRFVGIANESVARDPFGRPSSFRIEVVSG